MDGGILPESSGTTVAPALGLAADTDGRYAWTMRGPNVDEQSGRTALLSAVTTEHFVLQTANNSTYAEASAPTM